MEENNVRRLIEYLDNFETFSSEINEKEGKVEFSLTLNFDFDFDIKKSSEPMNKYKNLNKYDRIFFLLKEYYIPHKEKLEKHFEKRKLSKCCYLMVKHFGSNREWAEKIIEEEKDTVSAYLMFGYCDSNIEWAKKIIENERDSCSAYGLIFRLKDKMKYHYPVTNHPDFKKHREWAEKIVDEKNDLHSAYLMISGCGSDPDWYDRIKERLDKNENT